jgi:hypothetical protein
MSNAFSLRDVSKNGVLLMFWVSLWSICFTQKFEYFLHADLSKAFILHKVSKSLFLLAF